jgi:hypothetical protein
VPLDQAMKTKYGTPLDQLISTYGQAMGVPGLTP